MELKAIIVDDEAPARSELRYLLDETEQAEVVAEAASVREAIEKLKEYPCDVMFLDINMPEASGLQLAEALQHLKFPPAVVFVTAYGEFAIEAFKVNAIDYPLKPSAWSRHAPVSASMFPSMRRSSASSASPLRKRARRSSSASAISATSWLAMTMPTCRPIPIAISAP